MSTLDTILSTLAFLPTLGLIRFWTRREQAEDHPTLSPDLFPRPRLRHWLQARGRPSRAWELAEDEADWRRYLSIALSGHGTISVDSGEDHGGRGRVEREPKIRLVKGRRTA